MYGQKTKASGAIIEKGCIYAGEMVMPGRLHLDALPGWLSVPLRPNFIPIIEVTPQVWKRVTKTPTDKDGRG